MILRLRSGMMLCIHALQPVERYMRINLRGRNVGMAEDRLHRAQIGAILDHMSRTGMAQHVRAGVASRCETRLAHQLPDTLAGKPARARPKK